MSLSTHHVWRSKVERSNFHACGRKVMVVVVMVAVVAVTVTSGGTPSLHCTDCPHTVGQPPVCCSCTSEYGGKAVCEAFKVLSRMINFLALFKNDGRSTKFAFAIKDLSQMKKGCGTFWPCTKNDGSSTRSLPTRAGPGKPAHKSTDEEIRRTDVFLLVSASIGICHSLAEQPKTNVPIAD